jgi:uncharacterized protein YndB with AHSA1/START domain
MDATTERLAVEREVEIAAAPETVWEFLVDPAKTALWMGQGASFDVRPGGAWEIAVLPGNTASGTFVEVDPPHRLVYTFGWLPSADGRLDLVPPGSSRIEIELTPAGDGTTLRFLHRDLATSEWAASHAHGWDHYLGRLAIAAAGGDAGRDPWLDRPMS